MRTAMSDEDDEMLETSTFKDWCLEYYFPWMCILSRTICIQLTKNIFYEKVGVVYRI